MTTLLATLATLRGIRCDLSAALETDDSDVIRNSMASARHTLKVLADDPTIGKNDLAADVLDLLAFFSDRPDDCV